MTDNYFFEMRKFHNWIKNNIIKKYAQGKKLRLLDLASGKGGDMHKWVKHGITYVRGYDIDKESVLKAKKRFSKIKTTNLDYKFAHKDLSIENVSLPVKVDLVSCFFALHYFFNSSSSFNNIVNNISQNLKLGGFFIMAAFSDENLSKINYSLDTKVVKIKPVNIDKKSVYGKSISVWIENTVLDTPAEEYIIDYKTFINIMKKNGLILVEEIDFEEYFPQWNRKLKPTEKKLSFLNTSYVFIKAV